MPRSRRPSVAASLSRRPALRKAASQATAYTAGPPGVQEVNDELRQEGYPVAPGERPWPRRSPRLTVEPTETSSTMSSASPQPPEHCDSGGGHSVPGNGPDTAQGPGDTGSLLLTPAQAAAMLQVRESWLRRRAARRQVPCSFLGKHLRFSRADLERIVADSARPAATARPVAPRPGAGPRRPGRPRGRGRAQSRRLDV